MSFNFKEIHIGKLIEQRVIEINVSMERMMNFMKCEKQEIEEMYEKKNLNSELLMRWSKLLEYDFFRIYSHHLILYSPASSMGYYAKEGKSSLPRFKKNIYTKEIIDFILELINTKEKTKNQIINEYKIPKTTLYKWISKYKIG